MSPKAALFRSLLDRQSVPLLVIGAHDGLGARLGEEAGFDAIWASGLEISTSAGVLDACILGMSDFLEAAVEINHATRLPVICDCDNGFGNAIHVAHLVTRYEAAGIAAVCIEDKQFPKMNSFVPGFQKLVSVEEFTAKMRAATLARRDARFTIIARVEALIADMGVEEALRRAEAYTKAGADAILIHSKKNRPDEILEFLDRWERRSPIFVVPTTYPNVTATQLGEAGASAVIYANHGIRATIQALSEVLPEIVREKSTRTVEPRIAGLERVFQLQGIEDLERVERIQEPKIGSARGVLPTPGISWPVRGEVASSADRVAAEFLERQIEVLEGAGVTDLAVVGAVTTNTGAIRSFPAIVGGSLANLHALLLEFRAETRASLVFSNSVLVNPVALQILLASDAPISILVDPGDGCPGLAEVADAIFVECDGARRAAHEARLAASPHHRVLSIGRGARTPIVGFEFVGVSLLRQDGLELFLDSYERYSHHYKERPFGRTSRFEEASFADFLEVYLVDGGEVTAVELRKAWIPFSQWRSARGTASAPRGGAVS